MTGIKKMLVTGASGMVGSYVRQIFENIDIVTTDIVSADHYLDVRDCGAAKQVIKDVAPDAVLHLAAATNVEWCENNYDLAHQTNVIGTQNIALACQEIGCLMIYFSSGAVFSGKSLDGFSESDEPLPLSVYGKTKLLGEQQVSSLIREHFTIRTGWLAGGKLEDKKFIGTLVRQLIEGKKKLFAVGDKYGNPTRVTDLLNQIHSLIQGDCYGLYHIVNTGIASRFEEASLVCSLLPQFEATVENVSSDTFPALAPRSYSEVLQNYKLQMMNQMNMSHWRDAISEYLEQEIIPLLEQIDKTEGEE